MDIEKNIYSMSVCICMEFQYVDRQMSIHCYKVEYTYLHMPPPQAIRKKTGVPSF